LLPALWCVSSLRLARGRSVWVVKWAPRCRHGWQAVGNVGVCIGSAASGSVGGGWSQWVGVAGGSSICPRFGSFRDCGRWTVGRFGCRVGAAVGLQLASHGLRWSLHWLCGERKYRWWLEPMGGSGWWVERVACFLVRFVTAASARWVGLGGQVGAAVSPRLAIRRRQGGVHWRGGERKYRWWLEPRGGSGWLVERVACFLVRFVTAASARWVGLGGQVLGASGGGFVTRPSTNVANPTSGSACIAGTSINCSLARPAQS
jgi:hypothetical protein